MLAQFQPTLTYAQSLDASDSLAYFKQRFYVPQHKGNDAIYFCGNSLGLLPKNVEAAIDIELQSWKELAIKGYMQGTNPWLRYHEYLQPSLAKIMGAEPHEITVMNALTVNLHLMMLSFYKPTKQRYKIMMEAGAFPSDQYAVETQVKMHGFDPDDAIIEIAPRNTKKLIDEEDIISAVEEHKNSLALILFGGINYYTGQLFDIQKITVAAHKVNAVAGWDLAHVAGNVPMQLHDWDVDFAVWCSYKYLNAGPGSAGGVFIHEQHAKNTETQRLAGWWGNDEATRFKMEKGFIAKPDATGWNVSTSQVFNMVALKASLEIFNEAGINQLREKGMLLTGYLEFLLQQLKNISFEIITPADKQKRGAQLCLFFKENGKEIFQKLIEGGVVVDYREPGVIRVAPAPLYNSFEEVFRFYEIIEQLD